MVLMAHMTKKYDHKFFKEFFKVRRNNDFFPIACNYKHKFYWLPPTYTYKAIENIINFWSKSYLCGWVKIL